MYVSDGFFLDEAPIILAGSSLIFKFPVFRCFF